MPIYTPGRRRAIALLLLTSILLLTLDLRGNEIFDAARSGFDKVLHPFETAADVVTAPIRNAWNGITDYEEMSDRNRMLQEELDAQRADIVAARAAIIERNQLLALNDLESLSDYPTVIATVVGQGPTNIDQIIEINKGSNDGIEVGMAVLSTAGLVGKVTAPVEPDRARIMLITDSRYSVDVKIVPEAPPPTTTTTTTAPVAAVPGSTPGSVAGTTPPESASTSTTSTTVPPTTVAPADSTTTTGPTTTLVATTTTIDLDLVRETGGFSGQGEGELPSVEFLDNTPAVGRFEVGDLVFTSGSQDSLAPANIPVGHVANVIERSTSEGPMLEVQPFADLESLYFVRIVLYKPGAEVGGDGAGESGG
jgi:rod shape-determining protein MreC